MKRAQRACAVGLVALMLAGCGPAKADIDESIELHGQPHGRPGALVHNGSLFDRAELPVAKGQMVVLPKTTHVVRDGKEGELVIFMNKTLSYAGHGSSLHVRDLRTNMGCVTRVEGGKLVVATYGEWDSNIEGGTSIALVVRAPRNLRIETRSGLTGPTNAAPAKANGPDREQPIPGTDGWQAVPSVPDPERTAKKLAPSLGT